MLRPSSPLKPYGVEYTAEVWRCVEQLEWEDFCDVQRVLSGLAEVVSRFPPRALPQGGRLSLRAGPFVLGYEVQAAQRTLRLCLLMRLPAGGQVLAQPGHPPEA